jgi:hypothetical protein
MFILLTSSILLYVRLTFLHNQTSWATCFIRVLFRMTGIARVDGVIYSTDPIFSSGRHVFSLWSHTKGDMLYSRWTCHRLRCRHVYHTCAFRMSNMWDKDTLHSNGGCPGLDAVHAADWRLDTVSIVNGNVCGRFCGMLAQKVFFSAGTLTTFRKSISRVE